MCYILEGIDQQVIKVSTAETTDNYQLGHTMALGENMYAWQETINKGTAITSQGIPTTLDSSWMPSANRIWQLWAIHQPTSFVSIQFLMLGDALQRSSIVNILHSNTQILTHYLHQILTINRFAKHLT